MAKPLFTIVIPIVILLTLSDEHRLGPIPALLLSLVFPLGLGVYEMARKRRLDISATIGVISVVLTAVIGLFELPPEWIAAKEAAVPVAFAAFVLGSDYTRFPIVRMLFDQALKRDRVRDALDEHGAAADYRHLMTRTSWLWAGTMAASGVLRYILAIVVVTAKPGTTEFNHQLGEMTALRIPIVSIPVGVLMLLLIWFLVRGTSRLTDLPVREIFRWGDRIPSFLLRRGQPPTVRIRPPAIADLQPPRDQADHQGLG